MKMKFEIKGIDVKGIKMEGMNIEVSFGVKELKAIKDMVFNVTDELMDRLPGYLEKGYEITKKYEELSSKISEVRKERNK